MNDWQYPSLRDLEQNDLFPQKYVFRSSCALPFNHGHVTCHVTKISNEGNWRIGGEFTCLDQ